MKRWAVAFAGLALSVTLLPAAAFAGRPLHASPRVDPQGVGRHSGFHRGGAFGGHRHHHGHFHRKFHHGKFHHHAFVPWFPSTVSYYSPPVVYSPAPVVSPPVVGYSSPTVYLSPTLVYPEPAPIAAAPAAVAPMPTVVEHPTGRYELRGDGLTTAYVWVWIPNPPPVPPAGPPSTPEGPSAPSVPPESRSKIYRWTDKDGTLVFTNRAPEPPRSERPGPDLPGGDPS